MTPELVLHPLLLHVVAVDEGAVVEAPPLHRARHEWVVGPLRCRVAEDRPAPLDDERPAVHPQRVATYPAALREVVEEARLRRAAPRAALARLGPEVRPERRPREHRVQGRG